VTSPGEQYERRYSINVENYNTYASDQAQSGTIIGRSARQVSEVNMGKLPKRGRRETDTSEKPEETFIIGSRRYRHCRWNAAHLRLPSFARNVEPLRPAGLQERRSWLTSNIHPNDSIYNLIVYRNAALSEFDSLLCS
jgi:hypothetical protein